MSYGEGVYGAGIYAAGTEDESHTGIGQIGISGQSLIEQNYRAVGTGQIGISGQSLITPSFRTVGIGQIGISGQSIISKSYEATGIGQIGITGQSSITQNYRSVGIGQIGIAGTSTAETGIIAIQNNWISTHYRCYLTGAADALEDLELPISSFQTRMGSSPYRVYLSIVVHGVDNYAAEIAARPNGSLRIIRVYNYFDGSMDIFVMAEALFTSMSTYRGGKSGETGNLTGYQVIAAGTAQSIELADPIYRASDKGRRRYRCRVDPRVRPLDTVTINSETFDVDQIIHIIDTTTEIMEIQELM